MSYKAVKEVRTAARALGAWGDMVIFLKDGNRMEITALENYKEVRKLIEANITPVNSSP